MTGPARILCSVFVVAVTLASPSLCSAGWLTVTNDTTQEVVVQDGQTPDAKSKRGKTVRLLPGEVYREYLPGEGQKVVQIFDARCATKPLYRGPVRWSADEMALNVVSDTAGVRLVRNGAGTTVVPASVVATSPLK